jgi:hypothetical protein
MLRNYWSPKISYVFYGVSAACGVVLLIVSQLVTADQKAWVAYPNVSYYIQCSKNWGFLLIPTFAFFVWISDLLVNYFKSIRIWKVVCIILEQFHAQHFGTIDRFSVDGQEITSHKVTLFKFVRVRFAFCWIPWSGWVVPVARSFYDEAGYSIPRFKATERNFEGVAGRTYAKNETTLVPDLPVINGDSSDVDKNTFAAKLFVKRSWVDKRLKKKGGSPDIRSLLGIPVVVNGKKWGVLVIDSRNDKQMIKEEVQPLIKSEEYKNLVRLLDDVLGS